MTKPRKRTAAKRETLAQAQARARAAEERLQFIPRGELATLLDVGEARVSQLAKESLLVTDGRGLYPREENVRRLCAHLRDRGDLSYQKREKLRRENELLEIQLQRARNEVILVADAVREWSNIILTFRTRMLRIANKVSPRLPFCRSENEMEAVIDEEIREVLTDLSRPPDYGQPAQHATEAQPQP
jgi:hypothetical protein